MQYDSYTTSDLKDMAKVNVFVHASDADGRAMTLAPWTYLSWLAKKRLHTCNDVMAGSFSILIIHDMLPLGALI